MNKYLLLTPGPVNVANNVRLAITRDDICHREADFSFLLRRIEFKLLSLFQIKDKLKYKAIVITGSGTAANESILSSVVGNKSILILSNGEFGERLHSISSIYNKNTSLLKFKWGEKFSLKQIDQYLASHHVDVLMMVHHETSSGMLNSLNEIGRLSAMHGAMFMVDCVSSAGAEKIDMERSQISFCSSSSSKAVASYPGLSFVIGRRSAFERLSALPVKSGYLNLYKFYCFISNASQTPNTPAIPLFHALEQALDNILDVGVLTHFSDLKKRADFLRKGMSALGFQFFIRENDMSSVLTTVCCPKHINVVALSDALRENAIIVYGGKGFLKGKVFQVGNIGELSFKSLQYFLDMLESILGGFRRVAAITAAPVAKDKVMLPLALKVYSKSELSSQKVLI